MLFSEGSTAPSESPDPHSRMDPARASLLQPTLEGTEAAQPLYSVRANFFVAFFGGPFAVAALLWLNARRMNRLAQDGWILVAVAVAWAGFLTWVALVTLEARPPTWLGFAGKPERAARYLGKAVALGLLGLLYLRRKAFYRSQSLFGVTPPDPWGVGLGACALGMLLSIALVGLVGFVRP